MLSSSSIEMFCRDERESEIPEGFGQTQSAHASIQPNRRGHGSRAQSSMWLRPRTRG